MNFLRSGTLGFYKTLPFLRDTTKLTAFTDFHLRKEVEDQGKKVSTGRSWKVEELRLKSNEDLHKLWYVLLKEKNALKSDFILKKKAFGASGPQGRMSKVRVTMARLLTVINERKKVCNQYRKNLEEEYIAKQREEYERVLEQDRKRKELEPEVPEITFNLLRAKFNDLKRGIDNTDYIKKALDISKAKKDEKEFLDAKYDYKNKRVVKEPTEEDKANPNVILGFKSGILEQLNTGRYKISQQEVLRSHVKNWKSLDLKQKRKVLGVINARRAGDARDEFLKELNLLGQKIAYDKLQAQ